MGGLGNALALRRLDVAFRHECVWLFSVGFQCGGMYSPWFQADGIVQER